MSITGTIPEQHLEDFLTWAQSAKRGDTFTMSEGGVTATITWPDDDPMSAEAAEVARESGAEFVSA